MIECRFCLKICKNNEVFDCKLCSMENLCKECYDKHLENHNKKGDKRMTEEEQLIDSMLNPYKYKQLEKARGNNTFL